MQARADVVLGIMHLGDSGRDAVSIRAEAASLARAASKKLYIAVREGGAGAGLTPPLLRDLTHVFEGIASVNPRLYTVPLLPWAGWTADRVADLADVCGFLREGSLAEAGPPAEAAAGALTLMPQAEHERRSLVLQLLQRGEQPAQDVTTATSSQLPAMLPAATAQQPKVDLTPAGAAAAVTAAAAAVSEAAAAAEAAGSAAAAAGADAAAAADAPARAGAEASGAAAAAAATAQADAVAAAAAGADAAAGASAAAAGAAAAAAGAEAAAAAVVIAAAKAQEAAAAAAAAAMAGSGTAAAAAAAAAGAAAGAAATGAAAAARGATAAAAAAAKAAAGAAAAADAVAGSAVMQYARAAMGGTFDRLHCGHMLLLAAAALVSVEKLFVGVTADALLINKAHKELLQQYDERRDTAVQYLKLVRPGLHVEAGPLVDPKEPTPAELEPSMQALVVSTETLAGGEQINAGRRRRGVEPLQLVVVDVLVAHKAGASGSGEGVKLSSSELRRIDAAAGSREGGAQQ